MLDKQYYLYSADTGHFYSNHEKYLHDKGCQYHRECMRIQYKLPEIENKLKQFGYTGNQLKIWKSAKSEKTDRIQGSEDTVSEYLHLIRLLRHKRKKAAQAKQRKLENDLKKTETRIAELEQKITDIDTLMASEEVCRNSAKLSELSAEQKTWQEELDHLYEEWERLSEIV